MDEQIREIFYSEDYESFYSMLNVRQQEKYDYVEHIIKTQRIVNSKFIKKIEVSFMRQEFQWVVMNIER